MKLYPHINFGGRCREAFQFYRDCLGGDIQTMLTWGDSPMAAQVPTVFHSQICHATLIIGPGELAGVDEPFENPEKPSGFQLILNIDDATEAERVFQALAEKGVVILPMQSTFWAERYGLLMDQFGVRWEINYNHTTG